MMSNVRPDRSQQELGHAHIPRVLCEPYKLNATTVNELFVFLDKEKAVVAMQSYGRHCPDKPIY